MSILQLEFGLGGALPVSNSVSYTTPGTYTWIAPIGVTKVAAVAVGAGGSGQQSGGGGLGWKNCITVTPGSSYTVVVGGIAASRCGPGSNSYFINATTVVGYGGATAGRICSPKRYIGGNYVGCGGGSGGASYVFCGYGGAGGGAGGYSGNGGNSSNSTSASSFGSNGVGGGGGGGDVASYYAAMGGGGVGIFGQGTNGVGGNNATTTSGGGKGGSGGSNAYPGGSCAVVYRGGSYGGGGAWYHYCTGCNSGCCNFYGANGAVRIVWPSQTRKFPACQVGLP